MKQHPIDLIALDLDGTLLDSHGRVSAQNETAVKQALAQGIQVIIATGKTRWSAEPVIAQLALTGPGVFTQGLVICGPDGSIWQETVLEQDTAVAILDYLQQKQLPYISYGSDKLRVPFANPYRDLLHKKYDEPLPEIQEDGIGQSRINKLLISDEANNDATRTELAHLFGERVVVTQAVPEYIEILPPGTSKGRGVRWLLQKLGIAPTAVLAVGDGENDIELLQLAGVGVAVGNANERVTAVADFVVGTNDESGVAQAINQYALSTN